MQKNKVVTIALIGNPIRHSLSPYIWKMFAKDLGININYLKLMVNSDPVEFKEHVLQFFESGGLAISVTSPFKKNAYEITNYHTSLSNCCKVANLIYKNGASIFTDTTDGVGLVEDIENNHKIKLYNKNILIIGSGYVIDSILFSLIASNPNKIDLYARNEQRVRYLQDKFGVGIYGGNNSNTYDIIINSIPNSSVHTMFDLFENIKDNILCYDLNYIGGVDTNFLTSMYKINQNVLGINGLGMLVEQARVAFFRLFNQNPDTRLVINKLKNNQFS